MAMDNAQYTPEQLKMLQISWADGRDLADYFQEIRDAVSAEESSSQATADPLSSLSPLELLAANIGRMNRESAVTRLASERLRRELVAGRIVCAGRREDVQAHRLEQITPDFWIGARLDAASSFAAVGQIVFTSVRLISASVHEVRVSEEPIDAVETAQQHVGGKKVGGRPNSRMQVKQLASALLTDASFNSLPNRESQACEIRARLMGEEHRYSHHAKGHKTESLMRWIGEVSRDPYKV